MITKLKFKSFLEIIDNYKTIILEKIYFTTGIGLLIRKIDVFFKFKNRNFIVLGSSWPGLGDNLQFSTLPEEFWKQYKRYTYISESVKFRNSEIYDLVWGCNPYVIGTINRRRNIGDLPYIPLRNSLNTKSIIPNWEKLNGLTPSNSLPKIYYKPKSILSLKNVILVDLSSISMYIVDDTLESIDQKDPAIYKLSSLKKACNDMVIKFYGFTFIEVKLVNVSTKNKSKKSYNFSELVENEIEELTINSIFDYCDYINSAYGILTLYSGQAMLSSALKNSGSEIEIFCLITLMAKIEHEENSGHLFDNVNYIVC